MDIDALQEIDASEYHELLFTYTNLQDNDIATAYQLMINSSAMLEIIETLMVKYSIIATQLERQARAIEAKVSCEASQKSVAEGDRQAKKDPEVAKAWNEFLKAKEVSELYRVKVNTLLRIYYDSKAIWENANKVLREGRNH